MNTISFPGLGIGEFTINPTINVPFLSRGIAWYGIIICTGIILAFLYGLYRCKKENFKSDDFYDVVLLAVPLAIVFARLYYVVFDPTPNYHSFVDVIAVWRGGIAIYGAIIGGALGVFIMSRIKKKPLLLLGDIMAPCVMIGQIIGRWGNFVNAEAHGGECTLPWRMGIGQGAEAIFVHPTFLYESLWNLVGFLLIHFVVAKRKRYEGQLMFFWLSWYGFGRMLIEPMRTDSLKAGMFDVSTLVGLACFLIFGFLYIWFLKKEKRNGTDN